MQYLQHCKPAVDDETFQKMVDRQYEMLRRERLRMMDEQNRPSMPSSSMPTAAQPAKLEDHQEQVPQAAPAQAVAHSAAGLLPEDSSSQEVT